MLIFIWLILISQYAHTTKSPHLDIRDCVHILCEKSPPSAIPAFASWANNVASIGIIVGVEHGKRDQQPIFRSFLTYSTNDDTKNSKPYENVRFLQHSQNAEDAIARVAGFLWYVDLLSALFQLDILESPLISSYFWALRRSNPTAQNMINISTWDLANLSSQRQQLM